MDKVQKIKEEIERRINVCEKYSQLNLTESARIGNQAQLLELRELKDFIDSLPKQSDCETNTTKCENESKLDSFDAIMEVVNRRRLYEPSDFIPESFIPDLD